MTHKLGSVTHKLSLADPYLQIHGVEEQTPLDEESVFSPQKDKSKQPLLRSSLSTKIFSFPAKKKKTFVEGKTGTGWKGTDFSLRAIFMGEDVQSPHGEKINGA